MTTRGGSQPTGVVFNVQRSSFHDGPGIRTTVFFKGCPLRCPWCHNPESLLPGPQVSVNSGRCMSCGACKAACSRDRGPLAAGSPLGSDSCRACGACFTACPTGARQPVGREWTVEELLGEVLRDRLAYDTSGGGVTFSGGEPLAQPEFLLACLDACRRRGLKTAVDTCGVAAHGVVTAVACRTDLLLWDVKHLDARRHLELTGGRLEPILANLAAAAATGVALRLRLPLIAGVNDGDADLAAVAALAASLPAAVTVDLLPYHGTGAGKRDRLGGSAAAGGFAPPPPARLEALAVLLARGGVAATIGG